MPGAPFFSIVFFFTLFLLGLTSAFSLLEVMTTLILDTSWGCKIPRWIVCTIVAIVSALISLIYCTEFGLQALDAVDGYVNGVALFFVVWCECTCATSVYRCRDVVDQVGWLGYLVYTLGFVAAQALGIGIAYATTPVIGAGVGFGIYVLSTIAGTLLSKTPNIPAPKFWGNNNFISSFWYIAFYCGNQLTRDLNVVIGVGKNWSIPVLWAPIMKVCFPSSFLQAKPSDAYKVHLESNPGHCAVFRLPRFSPPLHQAHVRSNHDLRLQHQSPCGSNGCLRLYSPLLVQLDHPDRENSIW
jgi:solute carrier family 6 GABA transporter-like protein 1